MEEVIESRYLLSEHGVTASGKRSDQALSIVSSCSEVITGMKRRGSKEVAGTGYKRQPPRCMKECYQFLFDAVKDTSR